MKCLKKAKYSSLRRCVAFSTSHKHTVRLLTMSPGSVRSVRGICCFVAERNAHQHTVRSCFPFSFVWLYKNWHSRKACHFTSALKMSYLFLPCTFIVSARTAVRTVTGSFLCKSTLSTANVLYLFLSSWGKFHDGRRRPRAVWTRVGFLSCNTLWRIARLKQRTSSWKSSLCDSTIRSGIESAKLKPWGYS